MKIDFNAARHTMVECQIRPNKVIDNAVLAAFMTIPREEFVLDAQRGLAYSDEDLPIDHDRYLMEPWVHARLLQALHLKPMSAVLDIACGAGYNAAIMTHMGMAVTAVDTAPRVGAAKTSLKKSGHFPNRLVVEKNACEGCPSHAPYAAIFINGSVDTPPDYLVSQLQEGGKIVAVYRPNDSGGKAMIWTRNGDKLTAQELFDANVPILCEFDHEEKFVF